MKKQTKNNKRKRPAYEPYKERQGEVVSKNTSKAKRGETSREQKEKAKKAKEELNRKLENVKSSGDIERRKALKKSDSYKARKKERKKNEKMAIRQKKLRANQQKRILKNHELEDNKRLETETKRKKQSKDVEQALKGIEMPEAQGYISSRSVARKHKRKQIVLKIFLGILFLTAAITLCVGVLFKVADYEIKGTSIYTEEQILSVISLKKGTSMYSFDADEKEIATEKALPYLENVKIQRRLPSTLVITIKAAEEKYVIKDNNKNYTLLSKSLKILKSEIKEVPAGTVNIKGYTLAPTLAGDVAHSEEKGKDDRLRIVINAINKSGIENITEIDVGNVYETILKYGENLQIIIGTTGEIDYKLQMVMNTIEATIADGTLTDITKGTLDASTAGTVYFR